VLSETGHPDEALKSYRRAVVILDQLVHDHPTVSKFQNDLADTYYSIGNRLNDASRYSEALISYRLALEIQERLVRDHPAVNVYQNYLAATRNNIGNVLNATGDPTRALKSYRLALEIRERLARDNPTVHSYQGTLGIVLSNIAEIEMIQGRWRDAREHLERATERQGAALAAMPHIRLYRERLVTALLRLWTVCRAINEPAEADRVAIDAVRVVRGGAEPAQGDPGGLYSTSCGLALCIAPAPPEQRPALADEAVQMLKHAIAAGWDNAQLTSRDPDLAPLHERQDFRRLLAELFDRGFPADPLAR
jgi:tetratricopeptide (TPR) repeat protein